MDKMELWCRGVDLRDTTYGAAFSLQQGPAQELLAEGLQGQRVSSDGIARRQPVLDGEGRGIVQHAVIEQKLEDPTVEIAVGGNSCAAQELGAGNGCAGQAGGLAVSGKYILPVLAQPKPRVNTRHCNRSIVQKE